LQDNLGQRFGAAELRLVLAETNEMPGKAKGDDLAATVCQQAVKPHHSALDPIDVGMRIAFIECVLTGLEVPHLGVEHQGLGKAAVSELESAVWRW
jgi:hypothetical protein